MGQTQLLDAKFLNWVLNKKWFFCNLRHEWAKTQPLDAKFLNWVFNKKWIFAIEDMNGPNPTS